MSQLKCTATNIDTVDVDLPGVQIKPLVNGMFTLSVNGIERTVSRVRLSWQYGCCWTIETEEPLPNA